MRYLAGRCSYHMCMFVSDTLGKKRRIFSILVIYNEKLNGKKGFVLLRGLVLYKIHIFYMHIAYILVCSSFPIPYWMRNGTKLSKKEIVYVCLSILASAWEIQSYSPSHACLLSIEYLTAFSGRKQIVSTIWWHRISDECAMAEKLDSGSISIKSSCQIRPHPSRAFEHRKREVLCGEC